MGNEQNKPIIISDFSKYTVTYKKQFKENILNSLRSYHEDDSLNISKPQIKKISKNIEIKFQEGQNNFLIKNGSLKKDLISNSLNLFNHILQSQYGKILLVPDIIYSSELSNTLLEKSNFNSNNITLDENEIINIINEITLDNTDTNSSKDNIKLIVPKSPGIKKRMNIKIDLRPYLRSKSPPN
jgi:hypothetical protein